MVTLHFTKNLRLVLRIFFLTLYENNFFKILRCDISQIFSVTYIFFDLGSSSYQHFNTYHRYQSKNQTYCCLNSMLASQQYCENNILITSVKHFAIIIKIRYECTQEEKIPYNYKNYEAQNVIMISCRSSDFNKHP